MNKIRKEIFSKDEHILFAKMCLAAYDPPLGFITISQWFDKNITPKQFNEKVNSIKLNLNKKDYCSTLQHLSNHIDDGLYITNKRDINCYIYIYNNNVYIVFRGTRIQSKKQILTDLDIIGKNINKILKYIKNETSVYNEGYIIFKELEKKSNIAFFSGIIKTLAISLELINFSVLHIIKKLYKKTGKKVNLYILGHSLGGALATIYSFIFSYALIAKLGNFTENDKNIINLPINVCTEGSPKIGNSELIDQYNLMIKNNIIRLDRVISKSKHNGKIDMVTKLPPSIFNNYKQYGLSKNKSIVCNKVIKKLLKDMENIGIKLNINEKKKYYNNINNSCIKTNILDGKHPNGKETFINVKKTLDIDEECNYNIFSNIKCHSSYFGVSLKSLSNRKSIDNKSKNINILPAYKIFNLNDKSDGLGMFNDKGLAFMTLNHTNYKSAKESIIFNKIQENECFHS